MKTLKYIFLSAVLIGFSACESDDDSSVDVEPLPELTAGTADFSNYVAIGASYTAGFTDNALFIAGQTNSFPSILANQFANIGGGAFTQPLMSDNIGGMVFGGMQLPDGRFGPRLFFDGSGPAVLPAIPTTEGTTNLGGTFNNVGVPGAKSFHTTFEGYGALNPYFGRMASSPAASMIGDALSQNPTFFTICGIGGNDVLSFATSGGDGVDQTGNLNPLTYGNNDITDPNVFAQVFSGIASAMTANGAKGVVVNIPQVTNMAYFNTVPHNPIPLDAATAGAVNGAYAVYNATVQALVGAPPVMMTQEEADSRMINFEASAENAVVIMDESLSDLTIYDPALVNMRQATSNDLLVLPSLNFIGTEAVPGNPFSINGVAVPLADKWVLLPTEQLAVLNATDAYNLTIASVASSSDNIALVDFKSLVEIAATTGYTSGDFTMDTALVTGGLMSLDGVHLTARGYAGLANEILKVMDATFGSNFEASGNFVDVGNYPTNYSHTLQ